MRRRISAKTQERRYKAIGRELKAQAALERAQAAECRWTENADGNWNTGCGRCYCFITGIIDGEPAGNEQRFCGYCGKRIEVERS